MKWEDFYIVVEEEARIAKQLMESQAVVSQQVQDASKYAPPSGAGGVACPSTSSQVVPTNSILFSNAGFSNANGIYNKSSEFQWDGPNSMVIVFIDVDNTWHCYDFFAVVHYSCTPSNLPLGPWTVEDENPPPPTVTYV